MQVADSVLAIAMCDDCLWYFEFSIEHMNVIFFLFHPDSFTLPIGLTLSIVQLSARSNSFARAKHTALQYTNKFICGKN